MTKNSCPKTLNNINPEYMKEIFHKTPFSQCLVLTQDYQL